jgi:hypothetical protein
MAKFEITFWDGSTDEICAETALEAKRLGKSLNDVGVRKAVLIESDDDLEDNPSEELDENPSEDDDDLEENPEAEDDLSENPESDDNEFEDEDE